MIIRQLRDKRFFLSAVLLSCVLAVSVFLAPGRASAFCFDEAGSIYNVSADLLWGIAQTESGMNPRAVNWNTNGTYDYGLMQINSSWYRTLGPERWNMLSDACYNTKVGAWILAQCIKRYGYTWNAVGCYNSSSREKMVRYALRVNSQIQKALRTARMMNTNQ